MNTKTEEEMKQIILKNIPKDCYWEDMENLSNTPIKYIYTAMEEYASPLKKRIEELERAVGATIPILEILGHPSTAKELKTILNPSTNGKQD